MNVMLTFTPLMYQVILVKRLEKSVLQLTWTKSSKLYMEWKLLISGLFWGRAERKWKREM